MMYVTTAADDIRDAHRNMHEFGIRSGYNLVHVEPNGEQSVFVFQMEDEDPANYGLCPYCDDMMSHSFTMSMPDAPILDIDDYV